jgi:hypothetical protein
MPRFLLSILLVSAETIHPNKSQTSIDSFSSEKAEDLFEIAALLLRGDFPE